MMRDVKPYSISSSATIREAMAQINASGAGIALVVDGEKRLLGTATDGDIRRGILEGCNLDTSVTAIMNGEPFVVSADLSHDHLLRLMRDRGFRQVPATDSEQRLLGLFLLSDLVDEFSESVPGGLTAVVMAGGLGSRLHPHTEDIPKPLIEVGGKPILERIIEHLSKSGVDDIFITTRYLAAKIEDYFEDGSTWGVNISYARETKRLGTAGGLKTLESRLDSPVLVMNGDLVTDFKVRQMFDFHREHQAAITVGVRHYEMQVPYGVARVDGARVVSLDEKPTYDFFVNAGIYVLEPEVLSVIPEGEYYDITTLIEALIEAGQSVVSFPIVERWRDIGRPEDLALANEKLGS